MAITSRTYSSYVGSLIDKLSFAPHPYAPTMMPMEAMTDVAENTAAVVQRRQADPKSWVPALNALLTECAAEVCRAEGESIGDSVALAEALATGGEVNGPALRGVYNALVDLFGPLFTDQRSPPRLTVELVQRIHATALAPFADAQPGVFRVDRRGPSGEGREYVDPSMIDRRLRLLLAHVNIRMRKDGGDLERRLRTATVFFSEFLLIHPFKDGNGRTARLLFNVMVHDVAVVPISIHVDGQRDAYLDALRARWNKRPPDLLASWVLLCVQRSAASAAYRMLPDDVTDEAAFEVQ